MAIFCPVAVARIINIPDDYPTIQAGIDVSVNGDTVLVQPGTYMENVIIEEHAITLASLFLTTRDTSYISSTVIDGDSSGSVIRFDNWLDSSSVLTGFTITHGGAVYGGGGVYTQSSPIISNNVIENNTATRGGGIYSTGNPHIIDNIIRNNHVTVAGGGIVSYGGALIVERNRITDNGSDTYGGGIHIENSQIATIEDNLVLRNTAHYEGGGVIFYTEDMGGNIKGNVIAENEAEEHSSVGFYGGVYALVNNTICNNSHTQFGLVIYEYCQANLVNNIIWNNATLEILVDSLAVAIVTYCDIQGGFDGQGNINADPSFRNPENDDFRLMAIACGNPYDSPCIDAGHPDILDSLLDCDRGLGTSHSDMGAYGGGDSVIVGISEQEPAIPAKFMMFQNHPNPFNAATTIRYELPKFAEVTVDIYDILGRKVATLVSGPQQAGPHRVVWDATEYPSGIYFYRLKANDFVETKKMLLLK
jgi:hypothetical protein